ncbi:MAG TPA: cyclic pyranopterin monophosphate synthase MoaC [Dehalococcoidia bacterium]|nr:cyclic pyranopterin monophosphate synthase MoaC [Dehalococcoidia bacterium]
MKKLSHLDAKGRARMVDVSPKPATAREAVARGRVLMQPSTLELVKQGQVAKGDVLATAQLAGIMAAKKTSELIPLCHPLRIDEVRVDFELDEANSAVEITAAVKATERTGVEMEALTAIAVSALTLYDMLKAADRAIRISDIRLVKKSGGRGGAVVLE